MTATHEMGKTPEESRKERAGMGDTSFQFQSPDTNPEGQDQPAVLTGSVLDFPPPCELSARYLLRSFTEKEQIKPKRRSKAKKLLSKFTKPYWPLVVGARVAAISGGKIVQGVIMGTKAHPLWPAAFRRKGFAACWIRLDTGQRTVGYELRPIQANQTTRGQENV